MTVTRLLGIVIVQHSLDGRAFNSEGRRGCLGVSEVLLEGTDHSRYAWVSFEVSFIGLWFWRGLCKIKGLVK